MFAKTFFRCLHSDFRKNEACLLPKLLHRAPQRDFIEAILLPSKLFENLPHLDFYESKKWFLVNVDLCPKDEKLINAFSTMFLSFLDL